jgi:hypothetical protein
VSLGGPLGGPLLRLLLGPLLGPLLGLLLGLLLGPLPVHWLGVLAHEAHSAPSSSRPSSVA